MNINQAFREQLVSSKHEDEFNTMIIRSATNALASIGGVVLPDDKFEELLYEAFKRELIKRLL